MKGKTLVDIMSYTYIKRVKGWMECPVCGKRMTYSKDNECWACNGCPYVITEADFLDDFVFWFCDGCNSYLNIQSGFDRKGTRWTCLRCGFDNDISDNNIRN